MLLKARNRAESRTRTLEAEMAEQRARCDEDLEQLRSECEALQSSLHQRKLEVEESLQKLSDQHSSEVDEANAATSLEKRCFEEIQEQKMRALEEQVHRNQQ